MREQKPRVYDDDFMSSHDYCYGCQRLRAKLLLAEAGVTGDDSRKRLEVVMSNVQEEMTILQTRMAQEKPELSEVQRLSVCVTFQLAAIRVLVEEMDQKLKAR